MAGDAVSSGFSQNPSLESKPPPPMKKKRNLPGTPDPEAEVIALSPKTLLATNRFLCEICGKGFQRDQNLQLHRRGHNLPWKLKQRSTKEPRKRVYVCPEKSCVHHHPSRALGDLTGIKKHFCRKHGEKKWKCDKCSKRYAVQSDWKAHMKTCGTREYRCDCGTLFSRRDSFITHRAFCDALAEETARLCAPSSSVSCVTTTANGGAVSSQNPGGSMKSNSNTAQHIPFGFNKSSQVFSNVTVFSDLQSFGSNFFVDSFAARANSNLVDYQLSSIYGNKAGPSPSLVDLTSSSIPSTSDMKESAVSHRLVSSAPSLYSSQHQQPSAPAPDMSATALLQKAAQIGVAAIEPPFLWSLYAKNGDEGVHVEDGNKFENLFTVNPTRLNEIPVLSEIPGFSPGHHLAQRDEIGGQTRDFLGVNVQAVCPPSIHGWI